MCRPTISANNNTTPTQEDFMFLMKAITDDARQSQPTSTTTAPKRVRFASHVAISAPGPLLSDEVKDLWYSNSDLKSFKYESKQIIASARRGMTIMENDTVTTRGLEHCAPQRLRNRRMSIRYTVNTYQRLGRNDEQTANVSRRCSVWTSEIALIRGCLDFANVYRPAMVPLIPATPQSSPFDFSSMLVVKPKPQATMKREHSTFVMTNGDESRRVRRRTNNLQ